MIEARDVTKDYGTIVAVAGVSFQVGKGEIVGFLGPNGAGKSTTLRILAGFLGATSGSVRIDGYDIQREPLLARRSLGYMPEAAPLYPEMRVREYLTFRAALKRVPRRQRAAAVGRALDSTRTADVAETVIQHLSKGYRQRVALADALVASPPLLILDEPTAGLDPNQIREVRALIRELKATHTVLLSTHILSEVETTCDRAIVIDRGRLVAEGNLAELLVLGKRQSLVATLRDPEERAAEIARAAPGVARVEKVEQLPGGLCRVELELSVAYAASAEELARAWISAGLGVVTLASGKASLEDVFAKLTRGDPTSHGASSPIVP